MSWQVTPFNRRGRLQRTPNNATRLVMKKSKRNHMTPLLQHLHWLPISARIEYKLATLAYLPLIELFLSTLNTYQPSRSLRSSGEKLLKVPRINLKSCSYSAFSYQGPCCLELASIWSATISFPFILQMKPQSLPVSKILPH